MQNTERTIKSLDGATPADIAEIEQIVKERMVIFFFEKLFLCQKNYYYFFNLLLNVNLRCKSILSSGARERESEFSTTIEGLHANEQVAFKWRLHKLIRKATLLHAIF